jgi:hypothetical protein
MGFSDDEGKGHHPTHSTPNGTPTHVETVSALWVVEAEAVVEVLKLKRRKVKGTA